MKHLLWIFLLAALWGALGEPPASGGALAYPGARLESFGDNVWCYRSDDSAGRVRDYYRRHLPGIWEELADDRPWPMRILPRDSCSFGENLRLENGRYERVEPARPGRLLTVRETRLDGRSFIILFEYGPDPEEADDLDTNGIKRSPGFSRSRADRLTDVANSLTLEEEVPSPRFVEVRQNAAQVQSPGHRGPGDPAGVGGPRSRDRQPGHRHPAGGGLQVSAGVAGSAGLTARPE